MKNTKETLKKMKDKDELNEIIEVKQCKDCGMKLSLDLFHYSNKKRNIRKSYCKDCSYQHNKKHIAKDPLAYKSYMQRYYKENPEKYPGNHKNVKVPPVSGVYIVDCLLTDDSYIGCSKNIRNRKYKHSRNVGLRKNKQLSKLIKEYGWEAFEFRVLEECDKEVVFERETHWIQELQPNLNSHKNPNKKK